MEHTHRLPDLRHFTDLAVEAVWIADEQTGNDADHAQALWRAGFGFSGGRFLVQATELVSCRIGTRYELVP